MLSNRIVRALVGVVFAKAAVATGWYLYQKSLKEDNFWGKDYNLFKTHDEDNDVETKIEVVAIELPVEEKTEKPVRRTRAKRVVKSESLEKEVVEKKKPTRKARVIASSKEETIPVKKATSTKKVKTVKSEA